MVRVRFCASWVSINNGCQDHTTSPSASAPFVCAPLPLTMNRPAIAPCAPTLPRPPHPASRFVTIGRNAPLHRGGMGRAYKSDLPDGLSEIFFARGLDRNSRTLPVGQISWRKKIVKWLRRSASCPVADIQSRPAGTERPVGKIMFEPSSCALGVTSHPTSPW